MSEIPFASPEWRPENKHGYLCNFPVDSMSVVWTRSIPEAVDEIVVNPEASEMLSSNAQYLTNPDRLMDHAVMSCNPQKSNAMHIGPKDWTRSTVISKYPYVYNNNIGRYITMKGCSTTGKDYGGTKDVGDPWGFFGVKEAKKEIQVANALLSHGFRSALPIGYLALDPDVIQGDIYSFWSDERRAENMNKHLQTVIRNGDQPAILIRLTGSTFRLDQSVTDSVRAEILSALCTTMNIPFQVFDNLSFRKSPSQQDLDTLRDGFLEVLDRNCLALRSLYATSENFRRSNLIPKLYAEKDIDASFTHQDYEELIWDANSPPTVKDYSIKMTEYFNTLIQNISMV